MIGKRIRSARDHLRGVVQRGLATIRKQLAGAGLAPDLWSLGRYGSGGYYKPWSSTEAIEEGMESSTWVYVCVSALAQAIAKLDWNAYTIAQDGTRQRLDDDHPLSVLMDSPNAHQGEFAFFEQSVMSLLLTGNILTLKLHDAVQTDRIAALQTVRSDYLTPIPGDPRKGEAWIKGYDWQNEASMSGLPRMAPEDVIHVMFTDPATPYWGLSPMRAGASTLAVEKAASEWNMNSMDNRVAPSGILSVVGPGREPLTDMQWNQVRQQLWDQHQRSSHAREPIVIGSDMTWTSLGMSAEDLDFIQGRRMTREEICALFHVPPPVVGIQDTATYNNVSEAWLRFYLDAIFPIADRLANALTVNLAQQNFGADLSIGYERMGVQALSKVLVDYADTFVKLFNTGMPPVVIAQALGIDLPRYAGDTIGWLAGGLLPVSAMASAEGVEAEEAQPETANEEAGDDLTGRIKARLALVYKPTAMQRSNGKGGKFAN